MPQEIAAPAAKLEPLVKRYQRVARNLHVGGVGTMGIGSVHYNRHRAAHLGPARAAILAVGAAAIMVLHHPFAQAGMGARDAGPHRHNHTAGFVPRDHRRGRQLQRAAIEMQIAAAHAGCLDLQHHFARSRGGVRDRDEFKRAVALEHDAAHGRSLLSSSNPGATGCRLRERSLDRLR